MYSTTKVKSNGRSFDRKLATSIILNLSLLNNSKRIYVTHYLMNFLKLMGWSHVFFQNIFFGTAVITICALVWLFSTMHRFNMNIQIKFLWKLEITNRTLVRLFSFMHRFHMVFQVTFLWATVITKGTFFLHVPIPCVLSNKTF